jgi:hypothetical protein
VLALVSRSAALGRAPGNMGGRRVAGGERRLSRFPKLLSTPHRRPLRRATPPVRLEQQGSKQALRADAPNTALLLPADGRSGDKAMHRKQIHFCQITGGFAFDTTLACHSTAVSAAATPSQRVFERAPVLRDLLVFLTQPTAGRPPSDVNGANVLAQGGVTLDAHIARALLHTIGWCARGPRRALGDSAPLGRYGRVHVGRQVQARDAARQVARGRLLR